MRHFAFRFAGGVILLACAATLAAQESGPAHAPDFRAAERIAPLYFAPRPGAPFNAIARTLWVRTLPDGSTVTTQNARGVARDAEGRVFQERRTFVPVPDPEDKQSTVYATEYDDPVAGAEYHCEPAAKVCNVFPLFALANFQVPTGLQPDKTTYVTRESLGVDTFAGLDVQRTRETYTLYRESIGNSGTILRTIDYWYAPALGVNVQVKRHDPRDGDQTLWLTEVSLSTVDPSYFKAPADYRMIDHRNPGPDPRTGAQPQH